MLSGRLGPVAGECFPEKCNFPCRYRAPKCDSGLRDVDSLPLNLSVSNVWVRVCRACLTDVSPLHGCDERAIVSRASAGGHCR